MIKIDFPQYFLPEVKKGIESGLDGESLNEEILENVAELFFTRRQTQEDAKFFLAQIKEIIKARVSEERFESLWNFFKKLVMDKYIEQKKTEEKLGKLVDSTAEVVVEILYRGINGGICREPFESLELLHQLKHDEISQRIDRSLSVAIRVLPISELLQYFASLNEAAPETGKILAILKPNLEQKVLATYEGLPSQKVDNVMRLLIRAFARFLAPKMYEIYVSKFEALLQNGEITDEEAAELINESFETAVAEDTVMNAVRAAAEKL